ncbi:ABC transporter substrate-binding protein [Rhizobium sp. SEMIA 4085]|uniref:Sugar ABC transporter substrate-binding protein n=1 Tax=Rhizobium gallicum bv. gallicum R602sp TaxID=1041138 RepID=A0A0B4XF81_9HYPH|nr:MULTISPECIES: ABC transporter substrate-binding protein [Rhizobium]AJD45751.1 sugar ABC transporter substrate-binding protein [Rhizobium gallicum bv. gallicum R602sp]NNH29765.1 ABC transporter substrate-binding protein [Rhizobium sp. SEMIA 4085]TDW20914.1 carbohydrate ABC transporter substrate-binding protein (CUT1 family) [Rhizobium azibense]
MKHLASLGILASTVLLAATPVLADTVFLSTQLRPIAEATVVREELLKGVQSPVDYVVEEPPQFAVRMEAERQAGTHTISLVGALHGELSPLADKDGLEPLDDVAKALASKGMPQPLLDLGKLGKSSQQYIPWMQATYVMAARKDALQYLPQGADVNKLTYDQLIEWGKKMQEATGQPQIGFPAGPKGLMSRFFQGYFYPSFTGGVVRPFQSADAAAGWEKLKELWSVVNPNSTNYDFMQEPLLAGEVMVAWDHVARLKEAISSEPDQYVVFPAPAGPKGRGYMPVVAGLAVPKGAPDKAGAIAIIEHLTMPDTQLLTAQKVGFFPTLDAKLPSDIDPGVGLLAAAVNATQTAPDALISLLPVGLGDKGGEFNKVYMDSFQRIILQNEAVGDVLKAQGATLAKLMADTKAPCWAPDAKSDGACPVE